MNPEYFSALLRAGGEGLLRTNPVLAIDLLLEDWQRSDAYRQSCPALLRCVLSSLGDRRIVLPRAAVCRWADAGYLPDDLVDLDIDDRPRSRVLGIGTREGWGYVVPLNPVPAARWAIQGTFPFTSDDVIDFLLGLLRSTGSLGRDVIPERLAFRLENQLGFPFVGSSMTVAGGLAVLDQLSGHASTFFGAVAVLVESDGDELFRPVSDVLVKLEAAKRECGTLSLVIAHPDAKFDRSGIDEIWEVGSYGKLATRLDQAGLLGPLLELRGGLTRRESAGVLERLRMQVNHEHQFREAAEFGDRIRVAGPAGSPDPAVWMEMARLHAAASRHHGRFQDATRLAAKTYESLQDLGELGADDDSADAATEYAAALYSSHRFSEIPDLLSEWVATIEIDPRRFRPLTRVKVWNTLGRALTILGQPGWEILFERSLALNRGLGDEENVARTNHYRVHAHLRHGHVEGARRALDEVEGEDRPPDGDPWGAFLRASIARIEGQSWEDPTLETRLHAGERPYSAWLYIQATARQPGRKTADVRERLIMAIDLLGWEAGGVAGNICYLFASFLSAYVAATDGDATGWDAAITQIGRFLAATDVDVRRYYQPVLNSMPAGVDFAAAERLLNRVPYF